MADYPVTLERLWFRRANREKAPRYDFRPSPQRSGQPDLRLQIL